MLKYNVGDVVIIKSWDQMVEEFGEYGSSIHTIPRFTSSMRYLCETEVEIEGVRIPAEHYQIRIREDCPIERNCWYLSDDMILCRADELDTDNTESEVFGYEI